MSTAGDRALPGPPFDALLVVSFGGPGGMADVLPFLDVVTGGRPIPPERLAEVAERYYRVGGVSPINAANRALVAAVSDEFNQYGPSLPVYLGNRNWRPFLSDTMRFMAADGVRSAATFLTSPYSSYSSCRQYREDVAHAQAEVGADAPRVVQVRHYFNHPGFIEPMVERTREALGRLPAAVRQHAHLVFTAHSIPTSMAAASGPKGGTYPAQLTEAARLVVDRLPGDQPWELVYQSRSGSPSQPWLGPDVLEHLATVTRAGAPAAVLVPIGFICDHMEVVYDLDEEAARRAGELGLPVARAATVGTDPRFVAMVRDLVAELVDPTRPRPALGELGPSHPPCPMNCCLGSPTAS